MRSSLDLLDGVIGEFDDGLTSSAESEANHRRPGHTRTNQRPGYEARTNGRPGQGGRQTNQRPGEDKVRPELRSSHLSINEQIDDIFSQLTEEIYLDEKKIKENKIKLSRSPTRNRNDPLPPPPISGDSKQPPPPIDRKKKPFSPNRSSKLSSKYQDNKTLTTDKPRSKTSGSKSDNRHNHSLPHDRSGGGGEVILYEDHDFSNNTIEKVVADVHKTADYSKRAQVPPPMPEKQKIHLKNSIDRNRDTSKSFAERQKTNLSSQEAAVIEELKAKVTDKQGKISKFDNNRQQRGRSKQRDDAGNMRPGKKQTRGSETRASPRGPRVSSPQSSSQYVSMTDNRAHRRTSNNREDYRRSKSMGPLESRDQSSPRHVPRGHSPDRHVSSGDRSRYNRQVQSNQDRSRSNARTGRHESFNVDRRRDERDNKREMFDDRRDARRGRSQVRAGHVSSHVSPGHLMSPPSPAEAEETIAKLLPR